MILEYCNGGNLESFLESKINLSEKELRTVCKQVIKALKAMSDIHAVHRDIKNANILLHFPNQMHNGVNESYEEELPLNFEVKLADFGFAIILESDEMTKT